MSFSLSKRQWKTLANTFQLHQDVLMPRLKEELESYGYPITQGEDFIYGQGTIPVMVVAHCDTVHALGKDGYLANGLCYGTIRNHLVLSAGRGTGLGADDRAGVLAIQELLWGGQRPHVLFPDKEECGLIGAREAAKALADHVKAADIRFLIELDRANDNDCVFYDCDSDDAVKYAESFGFKKATGSCTDISVLMKEWGIAGTNLSVGYYSQHTSMERLRLDELFRTIGRVRQMLDKPPEARIPFVDRWQHQTKYPAANCLDYYEGGSYLGVEGGYCPHPKRRDAPKTVMCSICRQFDTKETMRTIFQNGMEHFECMEPCDVPNMLCDMCGATISRKDAIPARRGTLKTWICRGPCKNSDLNKPIKRADGYYHLRGAGPPRAAMAIAFQMLYGVTETIEEEIDAMDPDDEAALEVDLWEAHKHCLDDYCIDCRAFRVISTAGYCTTCNGKLYHRNNYGTGRAIAGKAKSDNIIV